MILAGLEPGTKLRPLDDRYCLWRIFRSMMISVCFRREIQIVFRPGKSASSISSFEIAKDLEWAEHLA